MIPIALAVIRRAEDGRILVARRRDDAEHLPGYWEFPGGKPLPGEALADCAIRETREELGVEVAVEAALDPIVHDYGERIVGLHPFVCRWRGGEPRSLGCAEWRWTTAAELADLRWPPANAPLLLWLRQNA